MHSSRTQMWGVRPMDDVPNPIFEALSGIDPKPHEIAGTVYVPMITDGPTPMFTYIAYEDFKSRMDDGSGADDFRLK